MFRVEFPSQFKIHFKVIYEVPQISNANWAEIVFTRLASAYLSMGGCNTFQAGISVMHAPSVKGDVYHDIYEKAAEVFMPALHGEMEARERAAADVIRSKETKIL